MGIEAAGDPHWFDHLDRDRQRSVLGLMYAEANDDPPPAVQVSTTSPPLPKKTGDPAFDNLLDILASPDT